MTEAEMEAFRAGFDAAMEAMLKVAAEVCLLAYQAGVARGHDSEWLASA